MEEKTAQHSLREFVSGLNKCLQRHMQYLHKVLPPYAKKNLEGTIGEMKEISDNYSIIKKNILSRLGNRNYGIDYLDEVDNIIRNVTSDILWILNNEYVKSDISIKIKDYAKRDIPVENIVYDNIKQHRDHINIVREKLKWNIDNLSREEIVDIRGVLNYVSGILSDRYRIDICHFMANIRDYLKIMQSEISVVENNKSAVLGYIDNFYKTVTPFEDKYLYNLKETAANIYKSAEKYLEKYIQNIKSGKLSADIKEGKIEYSPEVNGVIEGILDPICDFYNQKFGWELYPNIYNKC